MIEKRFEAVEASDFHTLVSNGRAEGRRLEFKRDLPGGSNDQKKEFLADVSALANTDGGDLIFGVEEAKGVATGLYGVGVADLDAEILKLQNVLKDGLDPRLPHVRLQGFEVGGGKSVLLVRVEASLVAPHRVTFGGSSRFFARHSKGKYEMDTTELRRAFAATDALPRRMRDVHHQAVEKRGGKEMPVSLEPGPALVFTLAPLSLQREVRDIDVRRENAILPPNRGGGFGMSGGFDGVVTFSNFRPETREVAGWVYNYRAGYVDQAWNIGRETDQGRLIWPKYIQEFLQGAVASSLARLRSHQVEGPWVAMATVVGVKGYRVIFADDYVSDMAWQDQAYLGEVIDDHLQIEALEPMWRAFLRLFGLELTVPWIKTQR